MTVFSASLNTANLSLFSNRFKYLFLRGRKILIGLKSQIPGQTSLNDRNPYSKSPQTFASSRAPVEPVDSLVNTGKLIALFGFSLDFRLVHQHFIVVQGRRLFASAQRQKLLSRETTVKPNQML
jgi:hypothetical protein